MALLDATTPTDTEFVSTYAEYIRELRAKCNELEQLLSTGVLLTVSRVTTLSAVIGLLENFVLADATAGEQTFMLPDPTSMIVGIEYKVKKIDATENAVILNAYGETKIDNADTLSLLLPNEVVTYVTDGENLWTV